MKDNRVEPRTNHEETAKTMTRGEEKEDLLRMRGRRLTPDERRRISVNRESAAAAASPEERAEEAAAAAPARVGPAHEDGNGIGLQNPRQIVELRIRSIAYFGVR